jgi:hypothetical protein
MTLHHWGTDYNAAQFVELAAVLVATQDATGAPGAVARVSPRPEAGLVMKVRDAATLADLADITVDGNGYWAYQVDSPDPGYGLLLSMDAGATFLPQVFWSAETVDAAMRASSDALAAVQDAAAAAQTSAAAATAAAATASAGVASVRLVAGGTVALYAADAGQPLPTTLPVGSILIVRQVV